MTLKITTKMPQLPLSLNSLMIQLVKSSELKQKERTDQQLSKDPRISMNNIMQGDHVLKHLEALPEFKKFEGE